MMGHLLELFASTVADVGHDHLIWNVDVLDVSCGLRKVHRGSEQTRSYSAGRSLIYTIRFTILFSLLDFHGGYDENFTYRWIPDKSGALELLIPLHVYTSTSITDMGNILT
ncbi:hypothetical protein KIN20_017352 [Parelaphostrongylus tenuis]|uniref:Uncharacterized protein n=1 Tax=Parelaphostrongylus tenuis TaxID=148309 RepID=A0AAD5QRE7_PARTN|nr:hypothetical protein KIN20_017352 [Parelaphostrongylus tenuis]